MKMFALIVSCFISSHMDKHTQYEKDRGHLILSAPALNSGAYEEATSIFRPEKQRHGFKTFLLI